MSDDDLLEKADEFANAISGALSKFTGEAQPFVASTTGERVTIRHEAAARGRATGIALKTEGRVLLSLVVEFDCTWDSSGNYLRVAKSRVVVYALERTDKEPLFRYDFERDPSGSIPGAHLQVHAHRDSFTHLLGLAALIVSVHVRVRPRNLNELHL